MPFLGAHMSIAGGLHLAFERLGKINGESLQIFTRNQIQWKSDPLLPEEVDLFRQSWEKAGSIPIADHSSYLINLASPDPVLSKKSVTSFAHEMERAALLGIPFLITHPGSHMGQGTEKGLRQFVSRLDRAISLSHLEAVRILIEATAGQGSNLGASFEEIAFILEKSRYADHLGVCFDTCHVFASGYDLRDEKAYRETMDRFDRLIGLNRIFFFHLNDSKHEAGSRKDRHEHIGKGRIGLEGFRLLLNDPRFERHPMVLETPKGKELKEDVVNLKVLRSLITSDRPSAL